MWQSLFFLELASTFLIEAKKYPLRMLDRSPK